MNRSFCLYSIVNACYMDENYRDSLCGMSCRNSHGLVYFKKGNTDYTFKNGKKLSVRSGDFLYLPKNSSYNFVSNAPGRVYCINIDCNDDFFRDGEADDKAFLMQLKRSSEIESIFKKTVREMYLKRPYYDLRVKSMIYELCAVLFTEDESGYIPAATRSKLSPAISYIEEHYLCRDIRIDYLAGLCGMSENYFRRLFTTNFGMSPIKYINERRIAYASEFLNSGLYSVSEVAYITGFDDVGYFSRTYKKITGEPPSKVKSGLQKKEGLI